MNQDIIKKLDKLENYLIQESKKINDSMFTHQLGRLMRQIENMRKVVRPPEPELTPRNETCTCKEE